MAIWSPSIATKNRMPLFLIAVKAANIQFLLWRPILPSPSVLAVEAATPTNFVSGESSFNSNASNYSGELFFFSS
jgi:hypothetical protein